jgi:hypothetical protein
MDTLKFYFAAERGFERGAKPSTEASRIDKGRQKSNGKNSDER